MGEFKFFLEGIGSRTVAADFLKPDFTSESPSIIDASKELAEKKKLKFMGHESLNRGYRLYYEKPSLLKKNRKTYIYYVSCD
ncbi:hypothetical protein LRR81_02695 [Metabacillus sp. GX 13764]|uniref:hypothetical protein n=1 Tax=Metabacillus kandeliae TaxID=2900151 RepID=UPI001E33E487|nr:hypothetical protein [Metabacillus kandeliae]MCD7033123.1 hypothetical protein [Metabacillus kandeliae]